MKRFGSSFDSTRRVQRIDSVYRPSPDVAKLPPLGPAPEDAYVGQQYALPAIGDALKRLGAIANQETETFHVRPTDEAPTSQEAA